MANVTIKDVAREAEVSVSTASKALSGKGSLKPDTVKRIKDTAKRLGYMPNKFASALPRKKLKIGVLMACNPIEVAYYNEKGIRDGFAMESEFGAEYLIEKYDLYTKENYKNKLKKLAEECDGIIAFGIEDDETAQLIGKKPAIALHSGIHKKNISNVSIDAFTVGRLAAQFLSICGSKKTAVIAGEKGASLHTENINGFSAGTKEYKMSIEKISYCNNKIETAYEKTMKILKKYPDVTGIFTTSYVAPGICNALKDMKKDKKVAVVGLDLYKETKEALNDGSLNAVIFQNQALMTKTAVSAIFDMISGKLVKNHLIRPELVLKSNLMNYEELLTDNYKFERKG